MNEVSKFFSQLDILAGWEPVSFLGSGSNGRVYHIRHTETGEDAALKWIHIEQTTGDTLAGESFDRAQAKLLDEIITMKDLNKISKEIVVIQASDFIRSAGSDCADAFIRMELLEPLLAQLNANTFTIGQTLRLVQDISSALSVCHEKNIVHGDIKPENILCGPEGYKLGDFGTALDMLRHNGKDLRGTPYFQPPEYRMGKPASVTGDLYSFGMMLYVMFNNGMLPYQESLGKESEQKAWQRCCEQMKDMNASFPPPQYAPDEIAQVIVHAVMADPELRFQTAQELGEAFAEAVSSLTAVQKSSVLRYNFTQEDLPAEEKIYLSTGRVTYGSAEKEAPAPAPAPVKKEAAGFDLPGAEPQPTTPAAPQKATADTASKPKKSPVMAIVAGAVAGVALIALLLVMLLSPKPIQCKAVPARFDAKITLTNVAADEQLQVTSRLSGAEKGTVTTARGGELVITGLVPGTAYEIDVEASGRKETFQLQTQPAADGLFHPVRQRIFACKSHLLQEQSIAELESANLLTEWSGVSDPLRNVPLSEQNQSILFSALAKTEQLEYPQASVMYIVLRVPGKAALVQQKPVEPLTLSDNYFRCMEDVSGLFDAYHAAYGTLPLEQTLLEIYWQDELIGSAEIQLNISGGV